MKTKHSFTLTRSMRQFRICDTSKGIFCPHANNYVKHTALKTLRNLAKHAPPSHL